MGKKKKEKYNTDACEHGDTSAIKENDAAKIKPLNLSNFIINAPVSSPSLRAQFDKSISIFYELFRLPKSHVLIPFVAHRLEVTVPWLAVLQILLVWHFFEVRPLGFCSISKALFRSTLCS